MIKTVRTYKDISESTSVYEWDGTNLIRETITFKATGKKYDIWYLYDVAGNLIGFEYSEISDFDNKLKKVRIYYEKNMQGDVIGLLDSRGAEIVTYTYDAWGNITNTICYEGNEVPFMLNHIMYRSYYKDNESGFYYLKTRYYCPETCRFVNADEVKSIIMADSIWGYNMYMYCLGNPVNNIDPDGRFALTIAVTAISVYSLLNVLLAMVAVVTVIGILTDPYVQRSLVDLIAGIGTSVKNACATIADCIDAALTKAKQQSRVNKYETHHIVAQSAAKASATRQLLAKVKIGVQDSVNKVAIKYNLHRRLHTNAYYAAVHALVKKQKVHVLKL